MEKLLSHLSNHPIQTPFGTTLREGYVNKNKLSAGLPGDSAVTEAVKDNCTQVQNNRGRHFIGCPQEVWSHKVVKPVARVVQHNISANYGTEG